MQKKKHAKKKKLKEIIQFKPKAQSKLWLKQNVMGWMQLRWWSRLDYL